MIDSVLWDLGIELHTYKPNGACEVILLLLSRNYCSAVIVSANG